MDIGHSSPVASEDELAAEIYERLRAWRRLAAEAAGRAPFEVMPDEVLRAIAEGQPRSVVELAALPGVTLEQVEAHGEAVIEIVMSAIAAGRSPVEAEPYAATGRTV